MAKCWSIYLQPYSTLTVWKDVWRIYGTLGHIDCDFHIAISSATLERVGREFNNEKLVDTVYTRKRCCYLTRKVLYSELVMYHIGVLISVQITKTVYI